MLNLLLESVIPLNIYVYIIESNIRRSISIICILVYSVQTRRCKTDPCPLDGYWMSWTRWSDCSASCGVGRRIRRRTCVEPLHGGKWCRGQDINHEQCRLAECSGMFDVTVTDGDGKLSYQRCARTHTYSECFFCSTPSIHTAIN